MRTCKSLTLAPACLLLIGCHWIDGPALRPLQALAGEFKLPIRVEQTPEELGRELRETADWQTVESNLALTNVVKPPEPFPDPMFTPAAIPQRAEMPAPPAKHTAAKPVPASIEPVETSAPITGESTRFVGWSILASIGTAIGWGVLRLPRKDSTRGKQSKPTAKRTTKRTAKQ